MRCVHLPTRRSLSHTPARKQAIEAGARGATIPGVSEDMLARVMAVDFDDGREVPGGRRVLDAGSAQGHAARAARS